MTDRTWSVLVVDDDFRVAGVHADIVEAAPGFSVSNTARTLAEATEAIKGSPPDLMLVDVFLPDGDGIELVHHSGIDAFILSAADEAATVRRAMRAGALGYLGKPFQREIGRASCRESGCLGQVCKCSLGSWLFRTLTH